MIPESSSKKEIAFVIYPGLTPLDLVGPLAVLSRMAEFDPSFETVIVAETLDPITGDNDLIYLPNKTFAEVPHPYAIVVPGGNTPTIQAMSNPAIRSYVRTAAQSAQFVGSVCTGALILASVGLLDGLETTTHWAFSGLLNALGARYTHKRWVENGNIINSAGVSAGVDMALFFVTRLKDEETARKVQLWLDYDPKPPFRIDWERLPLMSRFMRAYFTLTARSLVAPAKKLSRAGL